MLREETEVCGRCALHIQYFQTPFLKKKKRVLLARFDTLRASNVNMPKLCGCDFHISRRLRLCARGEDNAPPVKSNLSEKRDFYLDIVPGANTPALLPKNGV